MRETLQSLAVLMCAARPGVCPFVWQADIRESFENPLGIRVTISGGFSCGVTFQEETAVPDPFRTGRVVIPVKSSTRLWSVRNVVTEVAGLELSLRRESSGGGHPGATPPMNAKSTWDDAQMKLITLAHFRMAQPNSALVEQLASTCEEVSPADDRPAIRRQSTRRAPRVPFPYLYNVDIDGLRVLINLQSRDTLLQLADAYLSVVLAAIPSFGKPPSSLMQPVEPLPRDRASTVVSFSSVPDETAVFSWNKLFVITTRGVQISLMDPALKGILLIAANSIRVTNHVTQSAHRERVRLEVRELCLYVASTDVDVGAVCPWLWNFDQGKPVMYTDVSSLSESSTRFVNRVLSASAAEAIPAEFAATGVFNAITTPFPCTCTIMVSHQQNEHLAAWLLVPALPAPASPDDITTVRVSASVSDLSVKLEAKEFVVIYEVVAHTLMAPLPPLKLLKDKLDPDEDKVEFKVRVRCAVAFLWPLLGFYWLARGAFCRRICAFMISSRRSRG